MLEKKDELIHLIMDENVSAIQTIVEELSLSSDEVIELISKLLETGELKGTLAEDGQRFFKSDVNNNLSLVSRWIQSSFVNPNLSDQTQPIFISLQRCPRWD